MSRSGDRLARWLAFSTPLQPVRLIEDLQCLPEDHIEPRLAELAASHADLCFLIQTSFSDRLDPDGSNHHRTIRDGDWWLQLVSRHFPRATLLKGPEPDSVLIFARPPGVATKIVVGLERGRYGLARNRQRWQSRRRQKRYPPGKLSEQQLFALLDGKRVALVGNSRALSATHHGAAIDAAEIVIRCNRAPIFHSRSHGARTDWIATSAEIPADLPDIKGATHMLWMSPRRDRMPLWLIDFPRLFVNPPENNRRLQALTGARPSTGLMVIDLLLRSPCVGIDLYGFDFFKSQSVSGLQTKASAPHDFDGEEALVRSWAAADPRLTIHA